jgi:hypothetical protein
MVERSDEQRSGRGARSSPAPMCYVDVMAIKRITISVPEEVANRVKKAAGEKPVSTWVTELIEEHLDDEELNRRWESFYRDVNPGPRAEQSAEKLLDELTRPRRRKKSAA